jgi:hypothetical protein
MQPRESEIRWGDQVAIQLFSDDHGGYIIGTNASGQYGGNSLVWVQVDMATSWSVYLQFAETDLATPLEIGETINVLFNVQMGCGAANLLTTRLATLTSTNLQQEFFLQLPANTLQINFTLQPGTLSLPHSFLVGGMAAPLVDVRHHSQQEGQKHTQWMPPGFPNEEPVRYR